MPVCSYVVYPAEGRSQALLEELNQRDECEAHLSDQGDMIVLVTETQEETREKELQEELNHITDIQCIALSFAMEQNEYEEA